MFNDEIPKYKKKKSSSLSKSKIKSDHKHKYVDCLFWFEKEDFVHKGSYCELCGKVGKIQFFDKIKTENNTYRILTKDEILKKYENLQVVKINNIWQKSIVLSK